MHVYIYEDFLSNGKYASLLAKIETRITDLGLNGKICRLATIKNYHDLIRDEIRRGAKTIVAVGNNVTLNKVINAAQQSGVPVGFIPIGKQNNSIAAAIGIEPELAACDILSARRIEILDLGVVNNQFYFLTEAEVDGDATISLKTSFTIETPKAAKLKIINLVLDSQARNLAAFSPTDGRMELWIETQVSGGIFKKSHLGQSIFGSKEFYLEKATAQLILDKSLVLSPPAEIHVIPKTLHLIVGKNRNF
ncbi:MAG: diacylglycerol kinase family protein [Candidatus Falkowbacteria bacterium]